MFSEKKARLHLEQLALLKQLRQLNEGEVENLAQKFDWSIAKTDDFNGAAASITRR